MKKSMLMLAALAMGVTSAFAGAPVNKICPVKDKEADGKTVAEVEVAFCCDNCKGKFEKNPKSFVKKIAKGNIETCPVSGKEAKNDVRSNLVVAVCCSGCKGKVENSPQRYLSDLK